MADELDDLSLAGRVRREAILATTLRAVRRRRRARKAIAAAACSAAVLVTALLVQARFPRQAEVRPGVPPIAQPAPVAHVADARGGLQVEVIPLDPLAATRLATQTEPPSWTRVNDDELLAALADIGQPAGLVTVNGQTLLVTH